MDFTTIQGKTEKLALLSVYNVKFKRGEFEMYTDIVAPNADIAAKIVKEQFDECEKVLNAEYARFVIMPDSWIAKGGKTNG